MSRPPLELHTLPHSAEYFIAIPLFIVGTLLVASGVFSLDLAQVAVGVIASLAGLGLRRRDGVD